MMASSISAGRPQAPTDISCFPYHQNRIEPKAHAPRAVRAWFSSRRPLFKCYPPRSHVRTSRYSNAHLKIPPAKLFAHLVAHLDRSGCGPPVTASSPPPRDDVSVGRRPNHIERVDMRADVPIHSRTSVRIQPVPRERSPGDSKRYAQLVGERGEKRKFSGVRGRQLDRVVSPVHRDRQNRCLTLPSFGGILRGTRGLRSRSFLPVP